MVSTLDVASASIGMEAVDKISRHPPDAVARALRQEAGFGCPVIGCGSPYLTWHHFDPPWRERNHHEPSGMIALCREHHDQADSGAFTKDQLRKLKASPASHVPSGKFNWLRSELAVLIGSNYFIRSPIVLTFLDDPLIWFSRDSFGNLLLNLSRVDRDRRVHGVMRENFWMLLDAPADVTCPPSGRLLDVRYRNGDRLKVEFREMLSSEDGAIATNNDWPSDVFKDYPITLCEVTYKIAGTSIDITPSGFSAGALSAKYCN